METYVLVCSVSTRDFERSQVELWKPSHEYLHGTVDDIGTHAEIPDAE